MFWIARQMLRFFRTLALRPSETKWVLTTGQMRKEVWELGAW
jgi:hypothetical protein